MPSFISCKLLLPGQATLYRAADERVMDCSRRFMSLSHSSFRARPRDSCPLRPQTITERFYFAKSPKSRSPWKNEDANMCLILRCVASVLLVFCSIGIIEGAGPLVVATWSNRDFQAAAQKSKLHAYVSENSLTWLPCYIVLDGTCSTVLDAGSGRIVQGKYFRLIFPDKFRRGTWKTMPVLRVRMQKLCK